MISLLTILSGRRKTENRPAGRDYLGPEGRQAKREIPGCTVVSGMCRHELAENQTFGALLWASMNICRLDGV